MAEGLKYFLDAVLNSVNLWLGKKDSPMTRLRRMEARAARYHRKITGIRLSRDERLRETSLQEIFFAGQNVMDAWEMLLASGADLMYGMILLRTWAAETGAVFEWPAE